MSVYDPLQHFLKDHPAQHWKATFAEVERILRRPLPKSAYRHQAWWANQEGQGHSQTAAWRDIGWRTANLDLAAQKVEFEKVGEGRSGSTAPPETSHAGPSPALIRKAAMYVGTNDEAILYREALTALVQREAARRLAKRGGTAPDLEMPRRRRD